MWPSLYSSRRTLSGAKYGLALRRGLVLRRHKVMANLLPCPFCGLKPRRVDYEDFDGFGEVWAVFCDGCGIAGHQGPTEQEAADAWNKRAPVSA